MLEAVERAGIPVAERRWAAAAHLAALCGLWVLPSSVVAPVLIGLLKRKSPYVRHHAKGSFCFQPCFVLFEVAVEVAAGSVVEDIQTGSLASDKLLVVMAAGSVFVMLMPIAWAVLVLHAGIQAWAGKWYRYPLIGRLIR